MSYNMDDLQVTEIFEDEIYRLTEEFFKKKMFQDTQKETFFICTEHENFKKYFEHLAQAVNSREVDKLHCEICSYENLVDKVVEKSDLQDEKTSIIFLYDIEIFNNSDFFNSIENLLIKAQKSVGIKIVIGLVIPRTLLECERITAFSENELECQLSRESVHYMDLKKIIDKYNDVDIRQVFFAEILDKNSELLKRVLKYTFVEKTIVTNEVYYSVIYIRDVILAILYILTNGKKREKYNVAAFNTTDFQLISCFVEEFKELALTFHFQSAITQKYYCLNTAKVRNLGWKPIGSLQNAVYRVGLSYLKQKYKGDYDKKYYAGKLEIIRKLEVDILKEIDKICNDNNIKYFLVGGSLLGAVRHNGFIPWDDDLDIGMLREDYEKFRKICPLVLSEKYVYQSYVEEKESHYIFDKIRVKDTIFSTNFSANFDIENGVFLDILVYDKTSNYPVLQKAHIRLIQIWKRAINVKWVNRPRKKLHYKLTKILLPIMRKIPFSVFHSIFERILRLFEKSNNTFLIDGVGMNLKKGPFPLDWFNTIEYINFESMKAPIPRNYHDYLVHWYGENYMDMPVISRRSSGHSVYQLDLGKYVLNNSIEEV